MPGQAEPANAVFLEKAGLEELNGAVEAADRPGNAAADNERLIHLRVRPQALQIGLQRG
jgi:hypothetical protein